MQWQRHKPTLAHLSPSPLTKTENTESNEANQILEVKAKDSEKLDSESKRLTNRDISGYRPQYDKVLESYPHANPESTTDSESKRPASRDISLTAQYDNNSESKTMDCHAGLAPARNDTSLESRPHANTESRPL